MSAGGGRDVSRVAVLMSTYNGERYLDEQIRSILGQSGVEVTLFVRDDGSSDGTAGILRGYAADGRAEVTFGGNVGIGNSFMELLWSVPDGFDYFAFSDQDDVWMEDKLSAAVSRLKDVRGCALYASNLEIVDADGRSLGLKFPPGAAIGLSLLSVIHQNRCHGCTQVFNRELFGLLRSRRPEERVLALCFHDSWVALSAAACGTVVYDDRPHIRYRRYGGNYTRFEDGGGALLKRRLSKLFHPERAAVRSGKAREALRLYPEYVEKDPDGDLVGMLAEPRRPGNKAALIRQRKRMTEASGEAEAWYVLKVIAGLI